MAIELTARLTLSSCVSQLTDFYTTDIQEIFTDNGIEPVTISLCDTSGECLPYTISLQPMGGVPGSYKFTNVEAIVYFTSVIEGKLDTSPIFFSNLVKGKMKVSTVFKCGLHICGDFIKFNEKQERI